MCLTVADSPYATSILGLVGMSNPFNGGGVTCDRAEDYFESVLSINLSLVKPSISTESLIPTLIEFKT